MAGLDPAIHVFNAWEWSETWIRGSSPRMTNFLMSGFALVIASEAKQSIFAESEWIAASLRSPQ